MRLSILLVFLFFSCTSKTNVVYSDRPTFATVEIDTLLMDRISIRALEIENDKVWYASNLSRYGYYDLISNKHLQFVAFPDSLEFRSAALTRENLFFMNVGSPAYLFRSDKISPDAKSVYTDNHPDAFYDSMHFWDENDGIAIGDPNGDQISILITRDGGNSWVKSGSNLPKAVSGEAAFAASDSNISIVGDTVWIVSGGVRSRVFVSADKGQSWKVFDTPIVQGKSMTGIFSCDFYNNEIGFIAGGDYENQNQNFGNKAITKDGGKNWRLVGQNKGPGYISCVRFVPDSDGKGLVSVGAGGLYYSADSGENWKLLHDDASLYTIRFQNDNTAIAAGRNKIIRIRFQ